MILFLYGPDTYGSGKKLNEIIARYKEVNKSGISFHVFDSENHNFDDFRNAAGAMTMFEEKRFIVLKGLLATKDFSERFTSWKNKDDMPKAKDVICVFHEQGIDKRDEASAWLLKNAQSQEFDILTGARLSKWAKEFIAKKGIKITQGALYELLSITGEDLWMFENELQKLRFYKGGEEISREDIGIFLRLPDQRHIFALIDAFMENNKPKALRLLRAHIDAGDNGHYLFSMICGQFRNIAQAQDFLERGERDASKIAKATYMHPFVAKKSMAQARAFDKARIKKIYSQIVDFEIGIKTGKIEPQAALESFIFAG